MEKENEIFKNCIVHVLSSGLGKKRISVFETQVKKNGGSIRQNLSTSDITHIVIEDSIILNPMKCKQLLKHYKVKVSDYKNLKIVGTEWISFCLQHKTLADTKAYEYSPQIEIDDDLHETLPYDSETNDRVEIISKRFKTDDSSSQTEVKESDHGLNDHIIKELQKLADAYSSIGDQWRSIGYTKSISAIKNYKKEITKFDDVESIPGVTKKMAEKIQEILECGHLRKVKEICGSEQIQVIQLFTKIWGAGPSAAQNWYYQGFRTLDDLKSKANLTKQQKLGLKYLDDIEERMPRNEVEEIAHIVKVAIFSVEPCCIVEICGSYRRGKCTCGDVDIMVARKKEFWQSDLLPKVVDILKEKDFIADDLININDENHVGNHQKYLGLCRLPGENRKFRRLDIFVVPQEEFAPALMHYTGSALFNRSIRLLAIKKDMSLSEHSLLGGVLRQGKVIINEGNVIPTPNEESIFEHLGIPFRPPEEREIL